MLFLLFLSGCCRNPIAPILDSPQTKNSLDSLSLSYPLDDLLIDSTLPIEELQFNAQSSDERITVQIADETLVVEASENDVKGTIELRVTDKCDAQSAITFDVEFGNPIEVEEGECGTLFSYPSTEGVSSVFLAGDFNDWNSSSDPLVQLEDGSWQTELALEYGSYAYKFVVNGTQSEWTCDPKGEWFQCDPGQELITDCTPGTNACNSIVIVEDCAAPEITLTDFALSGNQLTLSLHSDSAQEQTLRITVDGNDQVLDWTSEPISLTLSNADRHTVEITAETAQGTRSNTLHVPFWTDAFSWDSAVMYFAFIDRFHNGDTSNDSRYGASWETGDYMGGDWQGLIDKLDYLDDMGVNALWLTSPLNNPEGIFDGSCGMTITGYHGYWPSDPRALEEHFGDESKLKELIQEAHDRGMRVLVDWVGNHTHSEHPWYQERPEWFTDYHLCTENDNWNQAPETCWFAPYVPTLNYYRADIMTLSIDEAIDFAKDYNIDGFRVDAVKHMPKAVHWNLQQQVKTELEHKAVGSPMEFYTVGETFSTDRGLIASYVGEDFLDGQFDFSLYFKLIETIAREEGALYTLEEEYFYSQDIYQGGIMSNFLGNHDVERFISHAAGEVSSMWGDGLCPNGDWRGPAAAPQWDKPYQLLKLAWTWILTHPGTTLMYYGDEIGLPGYHDPDNRQMMSWSWDQYQSDVQSHVSLLSNARQEYPQLSQSEPIIWWGDPDWNILAYALSFQDQHALVILNRSGEWRDLSNGLSWAGLPSSGSLRDIVSGDFKNISDDNLSTTLSPYSSQVWIWE